MTQICLWFGSIWECARGDRKDTTPHDQVMPPLNIVNYLLYIRNRHLIPQPWEWLLCTFCEFWEWFCVCFYTVAIAAMVIINLYCGGVTKPISSVSVFHNFFRIIRILCTTYWIQYSYLTSVTTTKLWWHLSNMNVIQRIYIYFCHIWNIPNSEIIKQNISTPHAMSTQ